MTSIAGTGGWTSSTRTGGLQFGHADLRGNWGSFTLLSLGLAVSAAVAVFILLPLWRTGDARTRPTWWLVYFAAIGVAFILVEISLMQRFALLLGHPSRSLVCVLGALLLSAGIGAGWSQRRVIDPRLSIAALCVALLAVAFAYPPVIRLLLPTSLATRTCATCLLVAVPGVLMGMPFPAGLRRVGAVHAQHVPWMWGVNGGATVLGSILAIALAMSVGFTSVLLLAAGGYAIALLALMRSRA